MEKMSNSVRGANAACERTSKAVAPKPMEAKAQNIAVIVMNMARWRPNMTMAEMQTPRGRKIARSRCRPHHDGFRNA